MSENSEKSRSQWAVSGVCVPAGLFIGLGVGWAMGYIAQGLFVGLGAGFLLMVIVHLISGK